MLNTRKGNPNPIDIKVNNNLKQITIHCRSSYLLVTEVEVFGYITADPIPDKKTWCGKSPKVLDVINSPTIIIKEKTLVKYAAVAGGELET